MLHQNTKLEQIIEDLPQAENEVNVVGFPHPSLPVTKKNSYNDVVTVPPNYETEQNTAVVRQRTGAVDHMPSPSGDKESGNGDLSFAKAVENQAKKSDRKKMLAD